MRPVLLLCSAILVSLTGCSASRDLGEAERGVERFHAQLNAGRFGPIYDEASVAMKASSSRQAFMGFLGNVHDKLGPYRSGRVVGWREFLGTNGHMMMVITVSSFANGQAQEFLTFRVGGKPARLNGYHIDAPALASR